MRNFLLIILLALLVVGCQAEPEEQLTENNQQKTENEEEKEEETDNNQQITDNRQRAGEQSTVNSEQSTENEEESDNGQQSDGDLTSDTPTEEPLPADTPTAESLPADTPTAELLPTNTPTIDNSTNDDSTNDDSPSELPIFNIPLSGDITQSNSEISGMAWYGDWLILLPQFPNFAGGEEDGRLFALAKEDVLAFLSGENEGPFLPEEITLIAPDPLRAFPGFDGYEAIVFDGDRAYLTVEARQPTGYLVSGEMKPDLSQLVLDMEKVAHLPSATGLRNKSDETILLADGELLTIHEINGVKVNEAPKALRFDTDLQQLEPLPFPAVEYRITDATTVDENGRFWAINYFFPGELNLKPKSDPIAETYGQGPSHMQNDGVARLVEMQLSETGINLIEQPPLQLELLPFALHNWEGIVRLDDTGFLLVTDKFPFTILGFVQNPNGSTP